MSAAIDANDDVEIYESRVRLAFLLAADSAGRGRSLLGQFGVPLWIRPSSLGQEAAIPE